MTKATWATKSDGEDEAKAGSDGQEVVAAACYRHKLTVNLWAESKMGLKQKIEEGLQIGSCMSIWATLAVYP